MSGNLYFWRSDFCALYKFCLPPRIKINTWLLTLKLIVIEDLCCKPVSLPRFVSGKISLFCTTYPLKVSDIIYSKAFTYFHFHAKSKASAFRLLLFQAAAFDKAWPLAAASIYKMKWLQIKLLLRLRPSVWLLRGFKVFHPISTYDSASTFIYWCQIVYTYSHIYSRTISVEYNISRCLCET